MKKILYGITKGDWGGAQRYVYDLITALPRDSYEAKVIMGGKGLLGQRLAEAGLETIPLDVLARDVSLGKDLSAFWRLFKIFRQERPDIIHLNSSKIGLLGSLAGRLAGVPKIIFTGHGWASNEDRPWWQKKAILLLHKLTILMCHKVIFVSAETKRQLAGEKTNGKMTIIHNGLAQIDFLTKDAARNFLQNQAGLEARAAGQAWIGSIAELHKNKGLNYLIEALGIMKKGSEAKMADPLLFIIGEGEERPELESLIKENGLAESVFLVGRTEEASRYLKAFDIFILPSITEALPYAVLEAGQAGLPIIATSVGGIPEIISDMSDGLLIRPKKPTEICQAISFLIGKPEKGLEFGQNIKKKVLAKFDKDAMAKKTIELYN